MTPPRRPLAFALVLLPSLALAAFWAKKSDEEELKSRLDTLKVHLYLAGKSAVAQVGTSDESRAVKEKLLVVVGGARASVAARTGTEAGTLKAGAETQAVVPRPLKIEEVGALAKALWDTREIGKQVLTGDKEALPPVLPVLLAPFPVSPELVSRIDGPTDHAMLFSAMALLKLHPDSPVPLPPEFLLYEAVHTEPAQVKIPGFAPQLSALKTYTLAMNELCDLAEKEALSLEALGAEQEPQLAEGLKLLTGRDVNLTAGQRKHLHGLSRTLAYGSLTRCQLKKDQPEKAQASLGLFLDAAEQDGVDLPELQLLRASLECSSKAVDQGKARLTTLAKRDDLSDRSREGLKQLESSCAKGEVKLKGIAGQVKLGRVIILVAWSHLRQSGLLEAFAGLPWVQAVGDFVTSLGNVVGKVPGTAQVSLGGSWDD